MQPRPTFPSPLPCQSWTRFARTLTPACPLQVVEQLFSSVLRCEPGQDFMRENEAALRCGHTGHWLGCLHANRCTRDNALHGQTSCLR